MDAREDLASILPFLPVILRSSSLFWPPKALESIRALSLGPDVSRVDSGEVLFDAILDFRESLGISGERLAYRAAEGYAVFFDELMSRADSRRWFGEVVPMLAGLLMRLPALLEEHYGTADSVMGGRKCGLRILYPQEPGIVLLSQELIAALLACSFLSLFPTTNRGRNCLPTINFDHLFAGLHPNGKQNQQQKILCIIHYFERVTSSMPLGFVSFERKVLSLDKDSSCIHYPEPAFWEKSTIPLCSFEVSHSGLIEDQKYEALEVDFANEYLGGGSLHMGCVQEEIRFMINPELIAGMLFLPSMGDNEAIEIVGAERFSNYAGYASSFQFTGDYLDKKPLDSFGRRRTQIIAIDALYNPRMRQYTVDGLLRETNKAFCGFHIQSRSQNHLKGKIPCREDIAQTSNGTCKKSEIDSFLASENEETVKADVIQKSNDGNFQASESSEPQDSIGVATGNWGCGAFGGDPVLKSIIQWLAASQALRSFILYYIFGEKALTRLEQVTEWVLEHKWTVGDLWSMMVEYSTLRLNGKTLDNFFDWLLPLSRNSASTDADYMSQ